MPERMPKQDGQEATSCASVRHSFGFLLPLLTPLCALLALSILAFILRHRYAKRMHKVDLAADPGSGDFLATFFSFYFTLAPLRVDKGRKGWSNGRALSKSQDQ